MLVRSLIVTAGPFLLRHRFGDGSINHLPIASYNASVSGGWKVAVINVHCVVRSPNCRKGYAAMNHTGLTADAIGGNL